MVDFNIPLRATIGSVRPDVGVPVGIPSGGDDTPALTRAIALASSSGIGVVRLEGGIYKASQIVLPRYVVIEGPGIANTELQQLGGSNVDFIISENVSALLGSGLTVSNSPLVPSFFGLRNLRVNGNKALQTAGRGIVFYGPAPILDNVLVYGAKEDNILTQYSNTSGSSGWQGQEEGMFSTVISRDSGGKGWVFQGPHNSRIDAYVGCFNADWGFKSETGANYDGGLDSIGSMHTYANGGDKGASFGEVARIGTLISDGDNVDIAGSNAQIGKYRGYNIGGARDGLVISGNSNQIDSINVVAWVSSTGRKSVIVSGSKNRIGGINLVDNGDNDGILISGNENSVTEAYVSGFAGAGRVGIDLQASSSRVSGEITNCKTALNYVAGLNNTVDLYISTAAGQAAVAGATPGTTDRFDIRSSGTVAGATRVVQQSATIPMDITTAQTITVAHGLLYTPGRQNIALTLLDAIPTSTAYELAYLRVDSVTATNVTIGIKLATAASAGTLARIGVMGRV